MKNNWPLIRNKYIWKEINTPNEDENANLLSVSQYSGIKPKAELIEDGDFLSRASTLKGYKCVEKGDLVINTMLAWNGSLGVSDYNGVVSPSYNVYRLIDPENWDTVFLHYYLRSEYSKVEFRRFSTGIIESRLRLYPEQFLNLRTPKIPIKTQRKIGEILKQKESEIETIKEKLKTKIQLMREYRSSLITQTVTKGLDPNVPMKDSGIEWLGEVPEHWKVTKLKYFVRHCARGITPSYVENEKNSIPVINQACIQSYGIKWEAIKYHDKSRTYNKGLIKAGDVLICSTGRGALGRVQVFPSTKGEYVADGHVTIVRTNQADLSNRYLRFLLSTPIYFEMMDNVWSSGSTKQTELNRSEILNMPIVVPPIDEQREITNLLEKKEFEITNVLSVLEKQLNFLDTYRSSLITAAVTGQIDVSDWKEAEEELETIL